MEGFVLILLLVLVIGTHSYVAVPRSTKAWSLHATSTNNGSLSFILRHDLIQPLLYYIITRVFYVLHYLHINNLH